VADLAPLIPPDVSGRARPGGRWPAAFGRRFFIALLLGLVWIGPAWWGRRYLYAMALWDAVILIIWMADYRRLIPPAAIQVGRRWMTGAALGVVSGVVLEVTQAGHAPIYAELLDDVPQTMRAEPPRLEVRVSAHQPAQALYQIKPTARGEAQVGQVYLRYWSFLQFAERWAVADVAQRVRVYPDFSEARRQMFYLIRSRQIEMEKRLKRQPGRGQEFESLRDYCEADDLRDICWTASARRGKLVSKTYQAERSQGVIIVLDAGRLMLARVGPEAEARTKLDCAVNATLSLAQVALYSGDSVGLIAYGRRIQARLPLARGRGQLRTLVDQLALVRGELAEADHARAADSLISSVRRRILVVWVTDLAETAATPEVIETALRLTPRHLVLFVVIGQPLLYSTAFHRPESVDQMYRYAVAQDIVMRRAALLGRLRENGVLTAELAPGALAPGVVNHYLDIKERGRV
jgi:uncharacterized protein (DUF58 family)